MHFITTLDELLQVLDQTETSDFPKVMKSLRLHASELKAYQSWKPIGYSRNCIKRTPRFELVLLCWNAGDATPIHDHDGQKCWVYQVKGSINEKRYQKEGNHIIETSCNPLHPGKLTYMDDRMGYHSLANDNSNKAMTLHFYMAPIDSCGYYCEEEKIFKRKTLAYDTFLSEKEPANQP